MAKLAPELPQRPPYPGAKDYPVADELLDDGDALRRLIVASAEVLPAPKPKPKKSAKKAAKKATSKKKATKKDLKDATEKVVSWKKFGPQLFKVLVFAAFFERVIRCSKQRVEYRCRYPRHGAGP